METELNLVDILKDCPKGTKLYSIVHGEVEFYRIVGNTGYPISFEYKNKKGDTYIASVTMDGKYSNVADGECILFPSKDQRDWSKFKVEPEMIDGEFYYCLSNLTGNIFIFIYKKHMSYKTKHYAAFSIPSSILFKDDDLVTNNENIAELRKATEEEKQQLLNAIKIRNYKWDEDKKTLEVIDVPHTPEKFYIRIGDIPSNEKSKVYKGDTVVGYEDGVSVYDCIETDGLYRIVMPFPLKEGQGMTYECLIQEITQCRYEIENPRNVYLVSGMEVGKGHDNEPLIKDVKILKDLTGQFNTKPDKFDITTFKPFDKVLVRDNNAQSWKCDFYNSYVKGSEFTFMTICSSFKFKQCIPYNKETKHLVDTKEMPPEKYITWEE